MKSCYQLSIEGENDMKHTTVRKIAGCLILVLLFVIPAGCSQSSPKSAQKYFTLAELKEISDIDAILSQFGQVRAEIKYYNLEGTLDYTGIKTIVKEDNDWKMNMYVDVDNPGDSNDISYAYVNGELYDYWPKDGSYRVALYLDDGRFETDYAPFTTTNILDANYDVGGITSVSTEGDTQIYVIHEQNDAYTESIYGVTGATLETIHYTDAGTGIVRQADNYMLLNGERKLLIEADITYGEDVDFTVPEYVTRCMDRSETRSITYKINAGTSDEKTYSYTVPKNALAKLFTVKEYDTFTDPQYETLYTVPENADFPDETILYLKEKQ
jgi:hypothetical protein